MINRPGIHAAVRLIIQRDSKHSPRSRNSAFNTIQANLRHRPDSTSLWYANSAILPYRPAAIEQMLNVAEAFHHIFVVFVASHRCTFKEVLEIFPPL